MIKTRTKASSIEALNLWWGNSSWEALANLTQMETVRVLVNRFKSELGYKHVVPYPIPLRLNRRRISYHLIHASDHDEAPRLMAAAFNDRVNAQEHAGQISLAL
ncbi:hypothetical protein [Paracoccus sp. 22332]|uniref:hypothetical protein n=1 Tax=Paracoccus sp. 22332 TaxID=3453913 RepID=UPI003F82EB6E